MSLRAALPSCAWRRTPCVALAAAGIALLVYLLIPAGSDVAAHLYGTELWDAHRWRLWDNFWYAGRYSEVNYSLLYFPIAALVGTGVVVVASAGAAAGAFCLVVRRQWPEASRWPVIAFTVLVSVAVLASTYPFLLGVAFALGGIAALQRRRYLLAFGAAVLTALGHPLAFLFLLVAGVGMAGAARGWWRRRRTVAFAVALVALAGADLLAARAFGGSAGRYPFDPADAAAIACFCILGVWLTRGLPDQRPLRAMFLTYGLLAGVVFAVSSPVGGNLGRLVALFGTPLLLVPLSARGFRPRWLVVGIVGAGLVWQTLPILASWRNSHGARAGNESFWYPVEAFLDRHRDPNFRVEVVATYGHWEALYLARRRIPLARGWYRQDDWPQNSALYHPLSARAYVDWLRQVAVHYVLLPDDPLDYSARHEAARLRAGHIPGLRRIARYGAWSIFALARPTPIATPRDAVRVLGVSAESLRLRVARPGRYRLRVRFTPYWRVSAGAGCVAPLEPWGTMLRATRAGNVTLYFAPTFARVVETALGTDQGCSRGT